MLISVDPGYTTGVVIAHHIRDSNDFALLIAAEVRWDRRFDFFASVFSTHCIAIQAIVIERFKLTSEPKALQAQIGSEIPSARVIGAIEGLAYAHKLADRLHFQVPYDRKQMRILAAHQPIVGVSDHLQDAYKHARYFIKSRENLWKLS